MGIKRVKPTTPGRRNISFDDFCDITKKKPEKRLKRIKAPKKFKLPKKAKGRKKTRKLNNKSAGAVIGSQASLRG